MTTQIVAASPGGSNQLRSVIVDEAQPQAHEVAIRHEAIGVNFIDVYIRSGLYPWPVDQDLVLGSEAAGVVVACGDAVTHIAVGDRVAYTLPNGAYATQRVIDASHVVRLPDAVSAEVAAAVMLKGLTVSYLVNDSYCAKAGDTVLFHAAAGGVGSLAGQWLAHLGVRVIGTAGGAEKCELALKHGYSDVIDYTTEDFEHRVKELTNGEGVHAVYDSVGADTVAKSLACLKRFGTLVCFGQSSGPVTDFKISDLASNSLRLTRPTLFHFTASRDWLEQASSELFELILSGTLDVPVKQRFSLADAAQAHNALESRQTTGSTVLLP